MKSSVLRLSCCWLQWPTEMTLLAGESGQRGGKETATSLGRCWHWRLGFLTRGVFSATWCLCPLDLVAFCISEIPGESVDGSL